MIISEDELMDVAKRFGISCIKTVNYKFSDLIVMDVESTEVFFNSIEVLDEKVVFYVYLYNFKEDYIIPSNELYDYYEEEILNKVNKHNEEIEKIDFDLPRALYIYVVKDGMPIVCMFENDPIKELGIRVNNEAIEIIEDEFYKEDVTDAVSKLEELRKYILKHATNIDMKNADLRYDYLANLVAVNGQFEGYERYFERYFGTSRRGSAKNFLDKLKYEYDEQKKI